MRWRQPTGQFLRFVCFGVMSSVLDYFVYILSFPATDSVFLAKSAGYLTGMVFSITANYHWTFGRLGGSRIPAAFLLYLVSLLVNVLVNQAVLQILSNLPHALTIAFLFALGTTTVINFVGLKLLFSGQRIDCRSRGVRSEQKSEL